MKKFGLKIGRIGLEFSTVAERDKAIQIFTHCSVVKVSNDAGPRYENDDSAGAFSVFERDTNEQTMNCGKCKCQFSSASCTRRAVPAMDWRNNFKDGDEKEQRYLCDACFAALIKEYEIFKAKKLIQDTQGE